MQQYCVNRTPILLFLCTIVVVVVTFWCTVTKMCSSTFTVFQPLWVRALPTVPRDEENCSPFLYITIFVVVVTFWCTVTKMCSSMFTVFQPLWVRALPTVQRDEENSSPFYLSPWGDMLLLSISLPDGVCSFSPSLIYLVGNVDCPLSLYPNLSGSGTREWPLWTSFH